MATKKPDPSDSPTTPAVDTPVDTAPAVTVVEFYDCACPCSCGNVSLLPKVGPARLSRHARCSMCGTDEHMAAHPVASTDTAITSPRLSELYVPTPEEAALARAAQEEVYQDIWMDQWNAWQADLPEKFRHAETAHPQVLERLRRLKAGEQGVASLLVLGAPGLGKTFLSLGYANAAIKAGYFKPSEVMFGSEAEILASVANSGFGDVEVGLRRLISPRVKMLVLDDVGRGTWLNEAMRPKVFSLILDKFWSQNRVIVMTSNLVPSALGEYLGEGAMDRLRSMVGNASLVLDTESKRRKVTDEMLARAAQEPAPVVPPKPVA